MAEGKMVFFFLGGGVGVNGHWKGEEDREKAGGKGGLSGWFWERKIKAGWGATGLVEMFRFRV
jgi:hypothetical protein